VSVAIMPAEQILVFVGRRREPRERRLAVEHPGLLRLGVDGERTIDFLGRVPCAGSKVFELPYRELLQRQHPHPNEHAQ
jgi:hypothetical protein